MNARLLMAYGLKPRLTKLNENLLHLAASSGNLPLFRHILRFILREQSDLSAAICSATVTDDGTDVGRRDADGSTIAHILALRGLTEHTRLLIEAGGSCIHQDANGATPLMLACSTNERELVMLVLHAAPDQAQLIDEQGRTALHYCCLTENVSYTVLKLLLEAGLEVNALDKKGFSALHYAVLHPAVKAVRLLLDCGANAFLQTSCGANAFEACPPDNHLVQVLLEQFFGLDKPHQVKVDFLISRLTEETSDYAVDIAQLAANLADEDVLLCGKDVHRLQELRPNSPEQLAVLQELLCKRAGGHSRTYAYDAACTTTDANGQRMSRLHRFCVHLQALNPALAGEWMAQLDDSNATEFDV